MELKEILREIVQSPELHAKWLNTLSLMENTGARKISACEHPVFVNEIILKHAAEEARHAYYLKKQISRLTPDPSAKERGVCPTYEFQHLLSPVNSYQYLHRLDIEASRYLKSVLHLSNHELRFASYLLVTYAIEVRADELYPVYQQVLDESGSKVNVKSIITEEEGHLEEMIKQLKEFSPIWETHAKFILEIEKKLFDGWIQSVSTYVIEPSPAGIH